MRVLALAALFPALALAAPEERSRNLTTDFQQANGVCIAPSDGVIVDSMGSIVKSGWDKWGYNYDDHSFSGSYMYFRRGDPEYVDYYDVQLEMRWNDAWMSSQDCDGDGKLDRHRGHASYKGSGAELITRKWREYEDGAEMCVWEQYTVFEAAPANAKLKKGQWFTTNGRYLGPQVWGQFVVVDEFIEDTCGNPVEDTGFY